MAEKRAIRIFRVGNMVRFQFGPNVVRGVVKEDRGPIGLDGRHLYVVQYSLEPHHQSAVELPEDQLELVQDQVALGH